MMKFSAQHKKFNNKKVETSEGVFDSKGEWQRWLFLKDAEGRGEIRDLRRQVKYVLIPTQYRDEVVHLKTKDKIVKRVAEREVTYTADFVYEKAEIVSVQDGLFETEIGRSWSLVVEDFKGLKLPEYQIKKKMMLYLHGITIREVQRPTEQI